MLNKAVSFPNMFGIRWFNGQFSFYAVEDKKSYECTHSSNKALLFQPFLTIHLHGESTDVQHMRSHGNSNCTICALNIHIHCRPNTGTANTMNIYTCIIYFCQVCLYEDTGLRHCPQLTCGDMCPEKYGGRGSLRHVVTRATLTHLAKWILIKSHLIMN